MNTEIDLKGLRETYASLFDRWGNNGKMFGQVGLPGTPKEFVQVWGQFDGASDSLMDEDGTADAKRLCELMNALPALLDEIERLREIAEGANAHVIIERRERLVAAEAQRDAANATLAEVRDECNNERYLEPLEPSSIQARAVNETYDAILSILNQQAETKEGGE